MGAAGVTPREETTHVEADTQTVLTVARAVVAVAAGETTVAMAVGGAQPEKLNIGGVAATGVVGNGAYHPHPSRGPTTADPAAAVATPKGEAQGGRPAETVIASAKDRRAEVAEATAVMVGRIAAALGSYAATTVLGSTAVIPGRTAQGGTIETVLLLAAIGLLVAGDTATVTASAWPGMGVDTETLHSAREVERAGATTTAVPTPNLTEGGGKRTAMSEVTAGEGANVAAGATTAKENVARSWAGAAAGVRAAALLMVGYHPTTLETSHETARGGASAWGRTTASTPLIRTRGT